MKFLLVPALLLTSPAAADPFAEFHQCAARPIDQNAREVHARDTCPQDGACVPKHLTTEMMVAADRDCVATQAALCAERPDPSACLTGFATALDAARVRIFADISPRRFDRIAGSGTYREMGARLAEIAGRLGRRDLGMTCTPTETDGALPPGFDRESRCQHSVATEAWLGARHVERLFLEVEFRAIEELETLR